MLCRSPMRDDQERAKQQWTEQEAQASAKRVKLKHLVKRLRKDNRDSPSPWPLCKKCNVPLDPVDMHWLFRGRCDSHGIGRLEDLVRRIVRVHGRRRTIRILRQLAK
jgi:hypothetical protein